METLRGWLKRVLCYFLGHRNVETSREKSFRETYIRIRCARCGREETIVESEE